MDDKSSRRIFLTTASASALLIACRRDENKGNVVVTSAQSARPVESMPVREGEAAKKKDESAEEISANEDMMREHGVIRRIGVLFRESAARLRGNRASVAPDVLQKAARLMRTFGEDYHEVAVEEAHVFPSMRRVGGPLAKEVDVLAQQHQAGRRIVDFVLASTVKPIGAADVEPLARALDSFTRMYDFHSAREDTVVYPAWRKSLSKNEYEDLGERFEEIEHRTFGTDGFDDAVKRIDELERALGLDLAAFTAPPPAAAR